VTQPGPGWYSDPQNTQQVRWWDGSAWSEHRRDRIEPESFNGPGAIADSVYVPMARYSSAESVQPRLTKKDKDRQIRKNNSMAYTGCVLALLSFLFNPFAILSVLGIVFGSIGLAKSHELGDGASKTNGRGTAIAAIVLGLVGLGFLAYRLSQFTG
jgi:hypothetical protein